MSTPIIIAHRGLHHEHPENSLSAFVAAWEAGFDWCECDVQRTQDEQWVVIHDEKLERTTDGVGEIAAVPISALRQLRLRRADGSMTDDRLPALADALEVIPPGCGLLLEVKPDLPLERLGNRGIVVQSFHRSVVIDAARSGYVAEFLTEKIEDLADPASLPGSGLNVRHDLADQSLVQRCRAAGKSIGVWTVNDESDIRRVMRLGVDRIITDEPMRVRQLTSETPRSQEAKKPRKTKTNKPLH